MLVGIDPALIESERARRGETSITKPRGECIFKVKIISTITAIIFSNNL